MSYGSSEWQKWLLGEEEGLKQIKAAYDAGINTFDTADIYSNGGSEVILGKAIKEFDLPRHEIVVMTKLCGCVGKTPKEVFYNQEQAEKAGYVNQIGLSRKHIFEAVKASLGRLQLDYIDVLQCHRFDANTPIEETMQALHDVVQAGYVRYIGMSSCYAWQFHAMQNYAINNKLTPFISMQNHYNLVYREEEREMMPTLKHFGVGSIPWSPLARGVLTRPLGEQTNRSAQDWLISDYTKSEGNKEIINRTEILAKKKGVSMAGIALAWSLHKDSVTAPIVGTTSMKNLMDLVAAVNIKLDEEDLKFLEEPYTAQPVLGFL
jgi:aryl-alcohol dehydrogenase-like predicted oxidoreductase